MRIREPRKRLPLDTESGPWRRREVSELPQIITVQRPSEASALLERRSPQLGRDRDRAFLEGADDDRADRRAVLQCLAFSGRLRGASPLHRIRRTAMATEKIGVHCPKCRGSTFRRAEPHANAKRICASCGHVLDVQVLLRKTAERKGEEIAKALRDALRRGLRKR